MKEHHRQPNNADAMIASVEGSGIRSKLARKFIKESNISLRERDLSSDVGHFDVPDMRMACPRPMTWSRTG